jgi:hypothetical protein
MEKSKLKTEPKFAVGELCFCYYDNPLEANEIDLYYCRIVELGEEHSTCKIYFGEEPDKLKLRGTFTDVCTADLKKL